MAEAFDNRVRCEAAAINITPLVDVLLVLLVIFMVAAPVLTRRIALTLPQAGPVTPAAMPVQVSLRIEAGGQLRWDGQAIPESALPTLMSRTLSGDRTTQPLLRIDASGDADYGVVARVLAAARNADWERVAFVRK